MITTLTLSHLYPSPSSVSPYAESIHSLFDTDTWNVRNFTYYYAIVAARHTHRVVIATTKHTNATYQ